VEARQPEVAARYFVLRDGEDPYLLAHVRWPDVAQAISEARPDWQEDPGLFDLPYDPCSSEVPPEEAASIAARWGAVVSMDGPVPAQERVIRRMPANWSHPTREDRRCWSLEHARTDQRAAAFGRAEPAVAKPTRRRLWRTFLDIFTVAPRDTVIDLRDSELQPLADARD
jgi:hypothetical protein